MKIKLLFTTSGWSAFAVFDFLKFSLSHASYSTPVLALKLVREWHPSPKPYKSHEAYIPTSPRSSMQYEETYRNLKLNGSKIVLELFLRGEHHHEAYEPPESFVSSPWSSFLPSTCRKLGKIEAGLTFCCSDGKHSLSKCYKP